MIAAALAAAVVFEPVVAIDPATPDRIVMGGIVLVGITIGVYERGRDLIDAAAPVVESCVKHPATRSPFKAHP